MRLRKLHLLFLLAALFSFWSYATVPGTEGSQTQGTQMAQAQPAPQPAPQPTAPARQVTHKGPKLRVGIVEFVNKTSYGAGRLGTSASDILTTELFKTGAFILIERAQLKQVLGEQALGQTGAVNPETAAQAGRVLGLNALVTGSISEFGVSTGGADYGIYKEKVQKAKCAVDVRVVDASTGQLLFADSGKGEYERRVSEVLGLGQRAGYDETLGAQALRSAISKFMDNLVQRLQSVEWSGAVAMVSGSDVYINAGRDVGLNPGDTLVVQTLGQEIYDPQTKVLLGRTRGAVKGELLVTELEERMTITKVRSGTGFQVGDIVLMGAEKEKPKSYAKTEPPSTQTLSPPAAIAQAPKGKSDVDTVPAFREEERVVGDNDMAIVIGIEKYQEAPPAEYSANDARTMRDYLMALGFKPRNITLLVDDQATMASLRKTINSWLPPRVREGSLVFFYYSGHGAPDPKTGRAYIVPHDGDPNYISDTGYPLDDLYDALGKLGAREVAVVLDACFSGAGGRGLIAKGAKPLVMEVKTKAVPQKVLVMASTQGVQISTTAPEKEHGLFTYFFLKGLRAGKGEMGALYEYIKPQVEDEAKMMNVEQNPSLSLRPENLRGKFKLLR